MTFHDVTEKTCSRCSNPRLPRQRYCREHKNAYLRDRRASHPDVRFKERARQIAAYYRDTGRLEMEPCRICGELDAQMHHPDYASPTAIVWLCAGCHQHFHKVKRRVDAATKNVIANLKFSEWCRRKAEAILELPASQPIPPSPRAKRGKAADT